MQNRLRPLGRAWGASGVAVGLAALSHSVAGGHAPEPLLLAVAWALGAVMALPFTSRRASLVRLAGLLLPAQLIYHVVFGGMHAGAHGGSAHAGPHGGSGVVPTLADVTASDAATHLTHTASAVAGEFPAGTAEAASAQPLMLLAHVLSAVLSVLVIRHAERAVAAAWDWCHLRLVAGVRLPRIPAPRRRAQRARPSWELPRPHLLGLPLAALRHRGPPAALAYA
ncbi:hypothetical protein [Galactobacter caseinivorans]|uniref:Uncharacterized protein n=1 Tax=Galactobacter caseinivorans TaxID=2676123 RepID=A0A496PI85_9MICC|nr:hypothetical protein [Galactobacter caseinivorans]RKW70199.1 hypothetical protein DWQ67_09670 [Galactobacter caseinivorans]